MKEMLSMQEKDSDILEKHKPEPQKKEYPGLIAIKIDYTSKLIMKAEVSGGIPAECMPMPV